MSYRHSWTGCRAFAEGRSDALPYEAARGMVRSLLREVDRLYGSLEDRQGVYRALVDDAYARERAAIVKWLRDKRVVVGGVAVETDVDLDEVANAIERGEHLK